MRTLAHILIDKFYSAEMFIHGVQDTSRISAEEYSSSVTYHCNVCNTDFTVEHKMKNGYFYGGAWNDDVVTCPICSTHHRNFPRCQEIGRDLPAPLSMRLTVTELKEAVLLTVRTPTIEVGKKSDFLTVRYEDFRFDVKRRRATWRLLNCLRRETERMELGDPFDTEIYGKSILKHLRSDNLSRESYRTVTGIMRVLRDAVRRKWREVHHYDLGALYVGGGPSYGRMLFPLMNIAFRLTFHDAHNLPAWIGNENGIIHDTADVLRKKINWHGVFSDMQTIRMNGGGVNGLIGAAHVGALDTPTVKRLLHEDVFQIGIIVETLSIIGNRDYLMEALSIIRDAERIAGNKWSAWRLLSWEDFSVFKFLHWLAVVCAGRSGKEIMTYLRRLSREASKSVAIADVRDTARLMESLPSEIQRASHGVKLKNLHDWLCEQQDKYKNRDYDLEVPAEIVKRLSRQMDMVKFFLPTRNAELQRGSREFHNCVRTYADSVHRGECQIVYMTDDAGTLTACLEIRGDSLVQAKLRFNKPVHQDSAVNGAVIDWCARVGLRVATQDVREMRYPAIIDNELSATA